MSQIINNIYLLSFDRKPFVDYPTICQKIETMPELTDWWHHLISCYILITPYDTVTIADKIEQLLMDHAFILVEISLENMCGKLSEEAWGWLKKYNTL